MKRIIGIGAVALCLLPLMALAAGLVPCTGGSDDPCTTADVNALANTVIGYFISLLGVIAVIVLIYVGFEMVTSRGNPSQWEKAKGHFANVVIGIIIILAAWLVIDLMLTGLTEEGGLEEWTAGLDVADADPSSGSQSGETDESGDSSSGSDSVSEGQYTDAEARAALSAAGISVNKTEAQGTSLEGINQATIDEVLRLKEACGCSVVITGGTESGHADGTYSHGNGYKVDIDDSSGITEYITSNYSYSYTRSDGAKIYTNGSVEYALESTHWDITVK